MNLFKRLADNLLAYLKMTEEERKTEKERLEKEKADYQDKISTAEGEMTALKDEWNKTKNLMVSYVNEDQAEDRAQAEAKLVAIESEMEQEKQELDDLKEKLAEVERQLADTDLQISDIAMSCGFNNLTSLSRCFKKQYGCSPSQFRNRIRRSKKRSLS